MSCTPVFLKHLVGFWGYPTYVHYTDLHTYIASDITRWKKKGGFICFTMLIMLLAPKKKGRSVARGSSAGWCEVVFAFWD